MRISLRRLALSASIVPFLTFAVSAQAQDAADDGAEETEIVVTGSLIKRPNNTAVSPIVSLEAAAVKEAGTVNLNDALNQVPSFTTSGNAATGGQGGGGRPDMAQGGGPDASKASEALDAIRAAIAG